MAARVTVLLLGIFLLSPQSLGDLAQPAATNERPIIGILAQEADEDDPGDTYIGANYVKFLESAGARVVPIFVGEDNDYYTTLFNRINGILIPGGSNSLYTSLYSQAGNLLYNLTIEANDKGDYFPMFGVCLGFQLLNTITAGRKILKRTDSYDVSWPLTLENATESRLLGSAPSDIITYLEQENVTENLHNWGVLMADFQANSQLSSFYRLVSSNLDHGGVRFVSTVEAYNYPIYGTQWHPEMNAFAWSKYLEANHSGHAVRVAQYIANFFVEEARRNTHKFPYTSQEVAAVISNYDQWFSGTSSFIHHYYFNLTQAGR